MKWPFFSLTRSLTIFQFLFTFFIFVTLALFERGRDAFLVLRFQFKTCVFHLYLRTFLVFQPSLEHIKGETSFFIFTIFVNHFIPFSLKNNTPLFQGKLNVWKCYFDCFRNKITILTTCFKMIYSKGSSTSESRFHS